MEIIRLQSVNRSELHDVFEKLFSASSEPYGRNLDALYDCLTCRSQELTIELDEASLLASLEDRYYDKLLRMLRDAAEENPAITLTVLE